MDSSTASSAPSGTAADDLCYAPASELSALYARKRLSPVEVAEAILRRVEALDPALNCYLLVDGERALAQARESEGRWRRGEALGPLDGVPASVKDLLLTRGWPTRRGSRAVSPDGPWDDDAPAVARLREQGAVLLGKTTTPEFGYKATTSSPLHGVTRNPWDAALTPGGSSGGAGAAVAAGLGPLALGTDGAGSIRIPCSFCGLFGIKATAGRVPAWPSSPFGTAATPGPMTRTVADGALLFAAITAPDDRDFHALPPDGADYPAAAEAGVRGLRVGFSPDFGLGGSLPGPGIDPAVEAATRDAVAALRAAGAEVLETGLDWPRDPARILDLLWTTSCARLAARMAPDQLQAVDPGFRAVCEAGRAHGLAEIHEIQEGREASWARLAEWFRDSGCDALLGPTMPVLPFAAERDRPEGWGSALFSWTPFTPLFNLTRHPAASVNAGFAGGLPVGVQVVGPMHQDQAVFRVAGALERELALLDRRPPL